MVLGVGMGRHWWRCENLRWLGYNYDSSTSKWYTSKWNSVYLWRKTLHDGDTLSHLRLSFAYIGTFTTKAARTFHLSSIIYPTSCGFYYAIQLEGRRKGAIRGLPSPHFWYWNLPPDTSLIHSLLHPEVSKRSQILPLPLLLQKLHGLLFRLSRWAKLQALCPPVFMEARFPGAGISNGVEDRRFGSK